MGWEPIKTAPKDGRWVLLVDDKDGMFVAFWSDQSYYEQQFVRYVKNGEVYRTVEINDGFWDCGEANTYLQPTHWMDLPDPPQRSG